MVVVARKVLKVEAWVDIEEGMVWLVGWLVCGRDGEIKLRETGDLGGII